jgi:hypothetical protein
MDQLADAVGATRRDDVLGTDDVGQVVTLVTAPRPGLGGVVDDGVATLRGSDDGIALGQVALHLGHAQRVEHRVEAAIEADHLEAALA